MSGVHENDGEKAKNVTCTLPIHRQKKGLKKKYKTKIENKYKSM